MSHSRACSWLFKGDADSLKPKLSHLTQYEYSAAIHTHTPVSSCHANSWRGNINDFLRICFVRGRHPVANAEESAPADLSCSFLRTATVERQRVGSPGPCVFAAIRLPATGRARQAKVTPRHSYTCVENTHNGPLADLRHTPLPTFTV